MQSVLEKPRDVCEVLDDLMTEDDVAELFGVTAQSVALWRKHDELPYVRIPGEVRDAIRYRYQAALDWDRERGRYLLTEREVGDLFGVSAQNVANWRRRHRLPHVTLHGTNHYRKREVLDWGRIYGKLPIKHEQCV